LRKNELGQIGIRTAEIEVKFDLEGTDHGTFSFIGSVARA
jgi:hypothetical protein